MHSAGLCYFDGAEHSGDWNSSLDEAQEGIMTSAVSRRWLELRLLNNRFSSTGKGLWYMTKASGENSLVQILYSNIWTAVSSLPSLENTLLENTNIYLLRSKRCCLMAPIHSWRSSRLSAAKMWGTVRPATVLVTQKWCIFFASLSMVWILVS